MNVAGGSPWIWLALPLAYLLGACPWTVWFGRAFAGIDIREVGSGNAGATNAIRATGWAIGLPAGLLDVAKGWAPPAATLAFASAHPHVDWAAVAAGWAAIAGHVWSPFLGFKGGKGVATAVGAAIAISPWTALGFAAVWSAATFTTRWVSLGSILGALSMPLWAAWAHGVGSPPFAFGAVVALWVVWTHRTNLAKLRRGAEPRFGRAQGPDDA